MRWIIFFILASVAVAFSDDQLLQQAMKNNALMVTKLDVVRFTNYSSRTQLKLNGKISTARFTNLSSTTQTKLNGKVDKTITVNGQALSGNVTVSTITGNAGTATALAANGTNCSAGQAALGVDASGNAEGCWTPAGTYTLPTATSSILGGVKPDGTSILNTAGAIFATYASVGADVAGAAAAVKDTTGKTGVLYGNGSAISAATSANIQTAIGAGVYQASGSYAPSFGTLTNTNLCTTNGTTVSCTTAPSTYAPAAQTMYIGTTSHTINRASASEALTGITSIDGSAAKLTTARTINGQYFDGTANIQTATSATSDYTATTWTPGYVTSGGSFAYSTQYGSYTVIGNRVFCTINLQTSSATVGTSNVRINLPVAAAHDGGGGIGSAINWNGTSPSSIYISGSYLYLMYRSTSIADTAILQASAMGTGAGANYLVLNFEYDK